MSAISKTKRLIRKDIPIDWLHPNEINPNKMSKRSFDSLVRNIEDMGFVDPLLVIKAGKRNYRIIGGHHRLEAAKYLGFDKLPCTIKDKDTLTREQETFQIVKHNMIKGKIDPQTFMQLYEKVAADYTDSELQELFGFEDEDELKKLIKASARSLPKEMQKEFKDAALELKTIDELSALLNKMFNNYGDTLKYGYMVVDYGGKKSVWLRVNNKTMKAIDIIGEICAKEQRTVDDLVGGVLQLIAQGKLDKTLNKLIAKTPQVDMDGNVKFMPTKDNLESLETIK